jgi:hypothetical protein
MVATLGGTDVPSHARDTTRTDKLAVAAVLDSERTLGRTPVEMPHNNKGYDIRSLTTDGHWVFIEVKGRVEGADIVTVTRNEILRGKKGRELVEVDGRMVVAGIAVRPGMYPAASLSSSMGYAKASARRTSNGTVRMSR